MTVDHGTFIGLLNMPARLLKMSGKPAQNSRAPCSNGAVYTIKLCRTGIDLKTMSKTSRKRASMKGDVPRVIASDFKEAGDHGTVHRCHRDLRQNDERA